MSCIMTLLQPIAVVNKSIKSLILCDFPRLSAQSYAITAAKQLAMPVVATGVVVDASAVANGEAVLGAIPPDRALHEPRNLCGDRAIDLLSIDVRREQTENAGAPAGP